MVGSQPGTMSEYSRKVQRDLERQKRLRKVAGSLLAAHPSEAGTTELRLPLNNHVTTPAELQDTKEALAALGYPVRVTIENRQTFVFLPAEEVPNMAGEQRNAASRQPDPEVPRARQEEGSAATVTGNHLLELGRMLVAHRSEFKSSFQPGAVLIYEASTIGRQVLQHEEELMRRGLLEKGPPGRLKVRLYALLRSQGIEPRARGR